MANFIPSKITAQDFNNGVEYQDQDLANNVQGDYVQAKTVNNLVKNALYTQELAETTKTEVTQIANSAKQTAEGALSQVNQVLEDKTLLPDVQKNYYNLGFYDTFVSNGDGTGTITRKTAYLTINGNEGWEDIPAQNGTIAVCYIRKLPAIMMGSIYNATLIGKTNGVSITTENNIWLGSSGISFQQTETETKIALKISDEIYTATQIVDYLNKNPIFLQYEREIVYTETVIENQSIHIADTKQNFYWNEEWRKGLNLLDFSKIKLSDVNNGTATVDYVNKAITFQGTSGDNYATIITDLQLLPFTTYTFSVNTTNLYELYAIVGTNYIAISNNPLIFTTDFSGIVALRIDNEGGADSTNIISGLMLNEGSHPYPYAPYYGGIVREKDLSGIQLFPQNFNPAETISGDWEDLGTVTVGSNTLHAYQKVSGGN